MTFEEFQATRMYVEDLQDHIKNVDPDCMCEGPGYIYDGMYYIEDWKEQIHGKQHWWTFWGNEEFITQDLEAAEKFLYEAIGYQPGNNY